MSDAPKHRQMYFAPNAVDMLAEPMPKQKFHQRNHVRKCQKCLRMLYHSGRCIACAAQAELDKKLAAKRELLAYCKRVGA